MNIRSNGNVVNSIALTVALMSCLSIDSALAKGLEAVEQPAFPAQIDTCPGPATHQPVYTQQDLENITLQMIANSGKDLRYRQCADITISADGMFPIGRTATMVAPEGFRGEYLGQGHAIVGLRKLQNVADHSFGLFLKLDGALVKDLEIQDMQYSGSHHAGAVASRMDNSELENIRISNAQVHSYAHESGAIAGYISNSTLRNLDVDARVRSLGGLAYSITNSELEDIGLHVTRSPGGATYGNFAGVADYVVDSNARDIRITLDASSMSPNSLAGFAQTVTRSHLESITVTEPNFPQASATAAGISREAVLSSLRFIRVTGNFAAEYLAGGIVGRSKGSTIEDSSFEGTVWSLESAGGIAGATVDIDPAFGTAHTRIARVAVRNAAITSPYASGGIIGTMYDNTDLVDSYAQAHVSNGDIEPPTFGVAFAGGLVGVDYGSGEIARSYFSGTNDGVQYSGGIAGWSANPAGITNAIYNATLMPVSNGVGTPATQSAMLNDATTWAGFDLDNVWHFNPGMLPDLRALRSSVPPTADFNGDGIIEPADIFAFLTAFFAQDPRADMNRDGAVTVADVFVFLMLYFAA